QSPPDARDVATLWGSLDAATRSKLATAAPRLVGSLDGFPVAVRDRANRQWVSQSIAALKNELPSVDGRALAESEQHQLHMLSMVEACGAGAVRDRKSTRLNSSH